MTSIIFSVDCFAHFTKEIEIVSKKHNELIKHNSVLFVGKLPNEEQLAYFRRAGFLALQVLDFDVENIEVSVFGFQIGLICVTLPPLELPQEQQTLLEYANKHKVPIMYKLDIHKSH